MCFWLMGHRYSLRVAEEAHRKLRLVPTLTFSALRRAASGLVYFRESFLRAAPDIRQTKAGNRCKAVVRVALDTVAQVVPVLATE